MFVPKLEEFNSWFTSCFVLGIHEIMGQDEAFGNASTMQHYPYTSKHIDKFPIVLGGQLRFVNNAT
jgi:hypothetical protein